MSGILAWLILVAILIVMTIFAPRRGDTRGGNMVRGLFRWARFWWCVAGAVESGIARYREVRSEMLAVMREEERA